MSAENEQFAIVRKQIDGSFACICPVGDDEFRHNFVKVVCGSTATV